MNRLAKKRGWIGVLGTVAVFSSCASVSYKPIKKAQAGGKAYWVPVSEIQSFSRQELQRACPEWDPTVPKGVYGLGTAKLPSESDMRKLVSSNPNMLRPGEYWLADGRIFDTNGNTTIQKPVEGKRYLVQCVALVQERPSWLKERSFERQPRYRKMSAGVVVDTGATLVLAGQHVSASVEWYGCAYGQKMRQGNCEGTPLLIPYGIAFRFCEGLPGGPWSLPVLNTLMSLPPNDTLQRQEYENAFGKSEGVYWTKSQFRYGHGKAVYAVSVPGRSRSTVLWKSDKLLARCVRKVGEENHCTACQDPY